MQGIVFVREGKNLRGTGFILASVPLAACQWSVHERGYTPTC